MAAVTLVTPVRAVVTGRVIDGIFAAVATWFKVTAMVTLMLASQHISQVAQPMGSHDQFWAAMSYVIGNGVLGIMLGGVGLWAVHQVRQ